MTKPQRTSIEALRPVATFARAERGNLTRITDALSRRVGRPITRQNVTSWLKADPSRIEPGLGMGLMLIEVGTALAEGKGKSK